MFKIAGALALILLTYPASWGGAQPASPEAPGAGWRFEVFSATGIGQPPLNPANMAQARAMTIRAALNDASNALTVQLQGLAVQGGVRIGALMDGSDAIRARVEGLVKGASQTGPPNYRPDGSIELTIAVNRCDVAEAVLPESGFASGKPSPVPVPPGAFSGLVVDCRGTGLSPAFMPRVVDDRGQLVYGPFQLTRDFAVRSGVAGYRNDGGTAERTGPNPLILRAVGAGDSCRTDAILTTEDAAKVRAAALVYNFLAQGRVAFLIE